MTCVTRIDREAQKVISRSVLSCAIVALCIGVALLALWGIVYAIDRSFDVELIIISCAPICFAVVVYILYLRLLSQADGSNSFNVYDFGKTTFSVKATRRGTFAGMSANWARSSSTGASWATMRRFCAPIFRRAPTPERHVRFCELRALKKCMARGKKILK